MIVKTYGCALVGLEGHIITIEVDVDKRGFKFFMVGLPDSAVREGQQRIETALKNARLAFPPRKIVVNLAPADIRKEGAAYDLPIAIGMLAGEGIVRSEKLGDYLIMGELSLEGSVMPIRGVLPIAIEARKHGFKGVVLPEANAREAAIVEGLEVYGVGHLREAVDFLNGDLQLSPEEYSYDAAVADMLQRVRLDFSDVKGQAVVKRALEVTVAGGHNVLMIGPPGSGKTMLARRVPYILPPMTLDEALETTKIHSVAGVLGREALPLVAERPFRAPHHTISDVALVGGGTPPMPGEISLAHHGVLFLDELPEFKRSTLEVLRQPLEDRVIVISRSKYTVTYPANFMMVAAMNPCPCGYYTHPEKDCTCTPQAIRKYISRLSGPLMDRIDIQVEVQPVSFQELRGTARAEESSATIRARVCGARHIQHDRYKDHPGVYSNAMMTPALMRKYCQLDAAGERLLKMAMERLQLSARAQDRILKTARTIADLEASDTIRPHHLAEAIQYRSLDRENWGMR